MLTVRDQIAVCPRCGEVVHRMVTIRGNGTECEMCPACRLEQETGFRDLTALMVDRSLLGTRPSYVGFRFGQTGSGRTRPLIQPPLSFPEPLLPTACNAVPPGITRTSFARAGGEEPRNEVRHLSFARVSDDDPPRLRDQPRLGLGLSRVVPQTRTPQTPSSHPRRPAPASLVRVGTEPGKEVNPTSFARAINDCPPPPSSTPPSTRCTR